MRAYILSWTHWRKPCVRRAVTLEWLLPVMIKLCTRQPPIASLSLVQTPAVQRWFGQELQDFTTMISRLAVAISLGGRRSSLRGHAWFGGGKVTFSLSQVSSHTTFMVSRLLRCLRGCHDRIGKLDRQMMRNYGYFSRKRVDLGELGNQRKMIGRCKGGRPICLVGLCVLY